MASRRVPVPDRAVREALSEFSEKHVREEFTSGGVAIIPMLISSLSSVALTYRTEELHACSRTSSI